MPPVWIVLRNDRFVALRMIVLFVGMFVLWLEPNWIAAPSQAESWA